MSNAKHTSGPWTSEVSTSDGNGWANERQGVTVTADDGNTLIAQYLTDYVEYPNNETNAANARLIASAPELLEALEELLSKVNANCVTVGDCNQAAEAIAKARGD